MSGQPPPPPPGGGARHPPPPPDAGGPAPSGGPATSLQGASLALRLGAKLVDWVVLGIALALLTAPLFVVLVLTGSPSALVPWEGVTIEHLGVRALYGAAAIGYFVWGEATRGHTPGKRMFNLRVVDDATGGLPTPGQAFLRSVWMGLFVVPWIGIPAQLLAAGAIAVTVSQDPEGRGWHDRLADTTRVVRGGA